MSAPRRRKSVAESLIELIRAKPDDPRVTTWIDELLRQRGRSTLPFDVKMILARNDR